MQRRNKNIRKACDEIASIIEDCSWLLPRYVVSDIKILTHRIKRTTWRGNTKTNKTTTAKIDVSTIPYY